MRLKIRKPVIKSIRWKLMIMYISLVFIVMIISGTFIIVMIKNNEDKKSQGDLEGYAGQLYEQTSEILLRDELSLEELYDALSAGSFSKYQSVLISARTFSVIYSSTGERGNVNYSTSVVASALYGEEAFSSGRTYADVNGTMKPWMEYARPVKNDAGDVKYVIYVRLDASLIVETIYQTTDTVVLAVFIALTFTGVLGILFSSTITEPIIALTKGAKDLASGRQDKEIPILSKDEIGQLTESFNNMANELKQTMADMENEKNKLEVVLYNMTDGVLAYDENGGVLHYNNVCRELLDYDGALGNISDISFSEMKKRLGMEELETGSTIEPKTLSIGDKYIHASFNVFYKKTGEAGGIIIVLQDITKREKLENMRKEFVANVSHEIRTPLTSVKSYTETLLDGALDDRATAEDFLKIINSEADRMTLLVRDLLELSKMDSSQMEFNMKVVDLNKLVADNANGHKIVAQRLNKSVEIEEYPSSLYVEADPERIGQVLNNIISNSLKYSDEGATVKVWLETSEFHHRIFIKDNGMGIPKEDLRRIFERFYRVDKARSRALGGTGLGLSIAQEIMESHGGKITASSEIGQGTTMIIRFPIVKDDVSWSEK